MIPNILFVLAAFQKIYGIFECDSDFCFTFLKKSKSKQFEKFKSLLNKSMVDGGTDFDRCPTYWCLMGPAETCVHKTYVLELSTFKYSSQV